MAIIPFGVLAAYMTFLYAIALVRRDNSTADVGYGIGFIVLSYSFAYTEGASLATSLMIALMTIWALRLAVRIYRKNRGKPEDFRYKQWRDSWGKTFYWRSYLQIYLLQGLVIALVSAPLIAVMVFPAQVHGLLFAIGIAVWCLGFLFEVIGDYQLDAFIRNPENKGRIMVSGLWRFSRHPNYFGESTMWIGMALMATAATSVPFIAWISPVLITFLLLRVSGVPLLEARWKDNPEWETYKARTSVFFPLPPRK